MGLTVACDLTITLCMVVFVSARGGSPSSDNHIAHRYIFSVLDV